ncbi:MAG: hypothetical protein PHW87_04895 [Methanothrix sp.]|nr:hypothetical protein [Methanothrix sp.]
MADARGLARLGSCLKAERDRGQVLGEKETGSSGLLYLGGLRLFLKSHVVSALAVLGGERGQVLGERGQHAAELGAQLGNGLSGSPQGCCLSWAKGSMAAGYPQRFSRKRFA